MNKVISLVIFLILTGNIQAQKSKRYMLIYDFQTKQFVNNNCNKSKHYKYYSRNKDFSIKVLNINRLKYIVESDVNEISYLSDENAVIKLFYPNGKSTDNPQQEKISNEELSKIVPHKFPQDGAVKAKEISEDLDSIKQELIRWENAFILLHSHINDEVKPKLDTLTTISTEDRSKLKNRIEKTISQGNELISLIDLTYNDWDCKCDDKNDCDTLMDIKKDTKLQISYISKINVDSIWIVINQLERTLKDENNYQYYFPEFNTTAEELQLVLRYKEKTTSDFISLPLPTLKMANFLRFSFGTGPLAIYTPNVYSYFKQKQGADSILISRAPIRNSISFAVAAFGDLDYQITPTFSLGFGVGTGLNLGSEISGNIYTGINAGFRLANKMNVAIRCGLAYSQKRVLKDELNHDQLYSQQQIDELSDSDMGITQQKWMPGFFAGLTISYLTKNTSKK